MANIEILGAREHNLQNVDIDIPRNQLVVFTGLSGSGKSSLAFDTIHAEGQRRYMETFSAYARHFIGNIERPDVDSINGLSPVISIEQKTTNKNPRSTVGTVTEIYDFVRLLYARIGTAYSHVSGEKMVKYTEEQILDLIGQQYDGKDIMILAPLVKARKGHYRELFTQVAKKGFLRVRVDGEIKELTYNMQVDRYKTHDIELVIDRVRVRRATGSDDRNTTRLKEAVRTAFKQGKGILMILENVAPSPIPSPAPKPAYYSRLLMDPATGLSYPEPEPNTFSFNSPYGACPHCNGLGQVAQLDLTKLIPDPKKSIREGAFEVLGKYSPTNYLYRKLENLGAYYHFTIDDPVESFSKDAMNTILYGTSNFSGMEDAYEMNHSASFQGIVNYIMQMAADESSAALQKWAQSFMNTVPCPECHGYRLKPESLAFKIDGMHIGELAELDLTELHERLSHLEEHLDGQQRTVAHEILREIVSRTQFMLDVGLGYLSLNRSSSSLSGGESQRIRLATQIGARLVNVLYILDEPSIGLHQRDNRRLINSLQQLRDMGNSVIVVEHDRDMIMNADHVVDIGPGAGVHGGKIIFQGSHQQLVSAKQHTLTLDYLNRVKDIPIPTRRPMQNCDHIVITGATGNNLKNVTFDLPLRRFVCITGVSGSGKSSLINETLHHILNQHFYHSQKEPLPYESISGIEHIDKVIEIDQSPIGRTPRSNPATYVGVFDEIRTLFTQLPSARIRGYKPGRFSFNVSGGRCEHCKGAGVRTIEMNFLPDVYVNCEVCNGKRYNRETLEIRYKGKSIADVLDMTINEAVTFFESYPKLYRKLKTLQEVGLGYITLGQQSTTLSGGEAQRIKLATELARPETGNTLYILDEPTTGLHFEDIRVLLEVLQRLVDRGNSVLVIEHNMDVIKVADWIVDMGPEGGRRGGQIMFEGTPEDLAQQPDNYTGQYLKEELEAMNQIKN
ncbi:MAG: excinuclease ABC subunit UvrA [Bacteroidales bacterium]|nr:excinuclease ABC subunit UvrA [Bacteroidales bacterium]MBR6992350.1 excinuclease ABC subunit UvrA [Bacteroidales bacterium]